MREERGSGGAGRKKPYVKPELSQVPLRPEEAVLGNCKGTGPSGAMASNCVPVVPCVLIGT
jgi:hypothetical protein